MAALIILAISAHTKRTNGLVGRATYAQPLQLWDNTSGKLTDFSTNFSYVINSDNNSGYGDGIAFFLAPNDSTFPSVTKDGGNMGLTNDSQSLNSTSNHFVAVEFDIISNPWDPPNEHVGIDINSMRSVANVTWQRPWSTESIMEAATGGASANQNIYSWSFSSNYGTDWTVPTDSNSGGISSRNTTGLRIGLVAAGMFLLGMLGILACFFWRKRERLINEVEATFEIQGPKKFVYKELVRATNNFSDQQKLGEGGFGGVYKGFVKSINSYAAVKRVSSNSSQGLKEYVSEVKIISRLRHRNLVQLLGWCHEKKNKFILVYEFMPIGSLDHHLFKGRSLLDWRKRLIIAQGLASSLLYLYEECRPYVVHRDIKSSNIMLDADFNVKLGDFGLARLVDFEKEAQTTVLAGTPGYMAPEFATTCKASKETDVFSYGVVALEIASGRKSINHRAVESEVILVEWIRSLYGTEKLLEAADRQLGDDFDKEEMKRLMIVGLWCAHPNSNLRPTIRQAILMLYCEAPLPTIHSYEDVVCGSNQKVSFKNTGYSESSFSLEN